MSKFFHAIGALLLRLLPVAKNTAEKVAPEIQREIDKILGEARSKVEGLKANHSVASIQKQLEDDVKAVKETAEHHIALIRQAAEAQIARAGALLPAVSEQLKDPTPPAPPAS